MPDDSRAEHGNEAGDSATVPFTHLPHQSPWPFMAAMGLFVAFFGLLPLMNRSPAAWLLVIPGLGLFLIGLAGWLGTQAREDIAEARGLSRPEFPDIAVWFTGFLILSEIFLFGTLFASYFYLRNWDFTGSGSANHFYVVDGRPMTVWGALPLVNTILLVSSSVTLQLGERFLKRGQEGRFRFLLGLTVLLGAGFLAGQVYEFYNFVVHEGFNIGSGPYASTFFCLTGLHGFHVTVGVLLLASLLAGCFAGQFSAERHIPVKVIGIYWHFVDVIWLFLVAVLYLRLL